MLIVAEHWQGSDVGRQRQGNEDSFFVRAPLFVVADGMGGAQAGEVASEMAVASFADGLPSGSPGAALVSVIEDANRRIHERATANAEQAGMGTTVTAAHVGEEVVTIAHVGDSRAYVLRDGELIRLTRDHTLVEELLARGKLTEAQAEVHPQRSVITRSVGPEPKVEVDVHTFPARVGDVFLVCSDGLTGMVGEANLKRLLEDAPSLERAGRAMIAAANDAGGRDNITVVLFRLGEVDGGRSDDLADTSEQPAAPEEARTQVRGGEALEADAVRAAVHEAARPRAEPLVEEPPAPPPRARSRPHRRRRRGVTAVVALAAVLAVVIGGFWAATRLVFFVGTDPDHGNAIAIYQGLPYELPFGIDLYSLHGSPSGVTLEQVPPARRPTFTDHKLRSLDDAENLVNALENGELAP